MGAIIDALNNAMREFSTEGVAASGLHKVVKSDVRAIGPLIEAAIANVGLGALITLSKETKAALDADLAHAANTVALVWGDATAANNDLYIKSGASGSGAWTNTLALQSIIGGLTSDALTDIASARTYVESKAGAVATILAALGDISSATSVTVEQRPATTFFAGLTFGGWAGVLKLVGYDDGSPLMRMRVPNVYAAASATKINLKVYSRADGTSESSPPPTGCTLLFDQDYDLATLGLTAGSGTRVNITFTFPEAFVKEDGFHFAYEWEARDAANARVASSTGYLNDASASAAERGWYRAAVGSSSYAALTSPNTLAAAVERDGYAVETGSDLLASAAATLSVDGFDLTVTGVVRGNGISAPFSKVLTVTPAASGKERMDKVVIDRGTAVISVVAGTERTAQLDAIEWQGSTPANAILLGRIRVTSASMSAASTANFRGLIKVGTEGEMAAHTARNRKILRKMTAKAVRGGTIKLGGYGDSITALQSSTPTFSANGTMRDRGLTYLANYPSDTQALLTLYNTGDGAGTVHTRLGWNWNIKAALEDLGATVTYNNYGIGGTTSQDTTNNGLDPARIAVPLADGLDVVVIAFGMNERGQSYSYANVLDMIGQFQAASTACVVMGCPRPNGNQSVDAWRYTNDALEAAAMDGGAAYVSTIAIADDRNLGGIGVPALALASANTISGGNNHPGIWELNAYGESAVAQLGLW